jgi:NDP-4-keto-2,6-dideoxyhexose 3-C-methyltransferase
MNLTERTICRSCTTPLPKENVLDLGKQTIVDFLMPGEKGRGSAPLQLVACPHCTLLQLRHTVDPDTLYREFWYRSGVNEQMREALQDIVDSAMAGIKLQDGDFVGDIGSNDGTLLSFYDNSRVWVKRVGFEPALALAKESWEKLDDGVVLSDYFSAAAALGASGGHKYKILTAIAMFYDLDNPVEFLHDVYKSLADDGVFIVQMNYLKMMLGNLAFDNIGHEHLCYYSLTSLNTLFNKCGLTIVDLELNGVNGGSIRVYAKKVTDKPQKMHPRVLDLLDEEKLSITPEVYRKFGQRVEETAKELKDFLTRLKKAGKNVYAYGASTRGSTLLQTVLRTPASKKLLHGVAERDPNKYGRSMAGLGLKILPEAEVRDFADMMLVLPYHFWPSISLRERPWMMGGGKFILPIPYVKVVSWQETGLVSTSVSEEREDTNERRMANSI